MMYRYIIKNCQYCNNLFKSPIRDNRKYCSILCVNKNKKKIVVIRTCLCCGKVMELSNHNRTMEYCSRKCFIKDKHVEKKCLNCEKIFESHKVANRKFCSCSCRCQYHKDNCIGNKPKYKILYNKDWLYQKYVVENLSNKQISDIVGCSTGNVAYVKKVLKITKSKVLKRKLKNKCLVCSKVFFTHYRNRKYCSRKCAGTSKDSLLYDKNWLFQKYVIEKLTKKSISKIIDCSVTNVCYAITKILKTSKQIYTSREKENRVCLNCDKTFETYTNTSRKFCSKSCSNSYCARMGLTGMKGKHFSAESRKKMRLSFINRLNLSVSHKIAPNYSEEACKFFEKINDKLKLKGIHARNNGEYYIKGLGYWVDYYEPNLNLVIEWDEKYHYRGGELRTRDIERQEEITNLLNCSFLRVRKQEKNKIGKVRNFINQIS